MNRFSHIIFLHQKTQRNAAKQHSPQLGPVVMYEDMPFDELLSRKISIEEVIKRREQKEIETLVSKTQALANTLGVSVCSLLGVRKSSASKARKKRDVRVRYQDGNGNTWTGRGKKPQWVQDLLAAGEDLEKFRVQ